MADGFVSVRILDNFYQTSSYFPMPVVLISTVAESGQTNLGPYSLCFPYIVAGRHSMLLVSRADSNTAKNIRRTGVCAINFLPDKRRYMKNSVVLGFPGETTKEKMANSIFTLLPSTRGDDERQPGIQYPEIVREALQVFECSWDSSFPLEVSPDSPENHYVLKIDRILMKRRWRDRLFAGRRFPRLPVDFGFRNNVSFWFTRGARPYRIDIPKEKGVTVDAVRYAVDRFDSDVEWQEEACARLVQVPRIFLSRAIAGCVEEAKAQGITEITPEFVELIRDKRQRDRASD